MHLFKTKRGKQKDYIERLKEVASRKDFKELEKLYYEYKLFCRSNNLEVKLNYSDLIGRDYILDVSLERVYGNFDGLSEAVEHLKTAISNNKASNEEALGDGISWEEAELLLKWVVKNAVDAIVDDTGSLSKTAMSSNCYFAQAVTAFPFITAGLPYTVNNTKYFVGLKELMLGIDADGGIDHPFITASLPVKYRDRVLMDRYLIDITFKQFFTADNCNEGVYSDGKTPDPGYFVCKTERGVEFATELLSKGYILLLDSDATIYGSAFLSASQNANSSMLAGIYTDKIDYISIMDHNQDQLAYSLDNADFMDAACCFPGIDEQPRQKTIGQYTKE